ncbi:MAG TPA: four helix bundle protein [Flavobacteriales bacterium]|nr:four helix bundle protein [Flavobacteriales bacterium]HRQ83803.1 four helix bundle protein [Flavobacteriales bacterium]
MKNGSLRSFTELVAWQKCRVLRKAISKLSKELPSEEKFRLTDQIIRSSRGPCANIAEGYGRYHENDNARFCRMAKGSLNETKDHLTAAYDEEYISKEVLKQHWALAEEALRVVNGYVNYLKRMGGPDQHLAEPPQPYGQEEDIFTEPPTDLEDGEADEDMGSTA